MPASASPRALAGGLDADGLDADGLDVARLSVAYGGNKAVSDVSLSAPAGRITGLIGPNGAGKTTTFNAVSGLVHPSTGRVRLFGADVTHRSSAIRARMGLGRTFQRMELVNAMTARTNVALGAECRLVGSNPVRQVLASPGQRRSIHTVTDSALEVCGIGDLAQRTAGTLSTGQRRLVELARVLAGGFRLLLLDEPSSGLDEDETERFGAILTEVVGDRGIGILLVEHDMALVMGVCDHIFVLEFGHLIFDGTPAETQGSELVRAAYLGSEAVEAAL
jgi:ABC-type branched-subunit amino acid transport system ATPase component